MSVDKLVDSTQLDSDLTSVANAIRTKGGTSAQLAFPAEFVQAIEDIETGGSSDFSFPATVVKTIAFKKSSEDEITVDFSKMTQLSTLTMVFSGTTAEAGWTTINIKPKTSSVATQQMFYCGSSAGDFKLKTINIDGTLKLNTSSGNVGYFANRRALKDITGFLDLTSVTRTEAFSGTTATLNMFFQCVALQNVSFVNGSMTKTTTSWNLSWCSALTDDSLISIANALQDTYSGTITFHATPKARLSTIMGSVTSDGTLSTFTKDASGTVSLQDFLTTTKGATVA